jgi:hypothetical protein
MPVDYKGGEHSKPVIRSFIASLVRLFYKGDAIQLASPLFLLVVIQRSRATKNLDGIKVVCDIKEKER